MQHDVGDDRTVKLLDTIKIVLLASESVQFVAGYLFLFRMEAIEQERANVHELRLLIGNATN